MDAHDARYIMKEAIKTSLFKPLDLWYRPDDDTFISGGQADEWVGQVRKGERIKENVRGFRIVTTKARYNNIIDKFTEMLKGPSEEMLLAQLLAIQDFNTDTQSRQYAIDSFKMRLSDPSNPDNKANELVGFNDKTFKVVFRFDRPLGIPWSDKENPDEARAEVERIKADYLAVYGKPSPAGYVIEEYARVLHNQEAIIDISRKLSAQKKKAGFKDLNGVYNYSDLSAITNRDSPLKQAKAYVVTKASEWYIEVFPKVKAMADEFKNIQAARKKGAPVVGPRPDQGTGRPVVAPKPSQELFASTSRVESSSQYDAQLERWADATINNMMTLIKGNCTDNNRADKLSYVYEAAGASKKASAKGSKTCLNLGTLRKVDTKNNKRIYKNVSGHLLFPDGRDVSVCLDVSSGNKKILNLIEWNLNDKQRSASNPEFSNFIKEYVLQRLFNNFVTECFPSEIQKGNVGQVSGIKGELEGDEEALERLAALRPTGESLEDAGIKVFGQTINPDLDIGIDEDTIRSLPMLPEGSYTGGGTLPDIIRTRELIASDALQIDDTEERLRILNTGLAKLNEGVELAGSTISRIRSDLQERMQPANVTAVPEGFAVYKPYNEERPIEVQVRIAEPIRV